ncbi:unnamed protein product [Chrysoparadoxa australica]
MGIPYVALVSGGKDSCFNAVECSRLGHQLICCANLSPPVDVEDEADSYMYQCAGSSAIDAVAECFGVPLVKRPITGTSSYQNLHYVPTEGDEVEDLLELLKEVLTRHPQVKGVSCGAIFSTYQRTRLENVCQRLGLTPLTYLWYAREQSTLLRDMLSSGVDAVLVKVASLGLEPHKHLGKSLSSLEPYFYTLHDKYQFHVCGEGGEYETMTLDCSLFVKRLVLEETEVVIHSDDGVAPVGLLRIVKCRAVEKSTSLGDAEVCSSVGNDRARVHRMREYVPAEVRPPVATVATTWKVLPQVYHSGGHLHLSSITCRGLSPPAEQMDWCLNTLSATLKVHAATMDDVCFVHLYLADMGDFAEVNAAYCKWFGEYPPSRACVACCLPKGSSVMLDCVAQRGSGAELRAPEGSSRSSERSVLHVRSLSYWAPLCIGPYSQANTLAQGSLLYIAGQIGLLPESMTLVLGGIIEELPWCLRNAAQVASVLNGSLGGAAGLIVYVSKEAMGHQVLADPQWWEWLDDQITLQLQAQDAEEDQEGDWESSENSPSDVQSSPVLVVPVKALPKGSCVEVEGLFLSGPTLELLHKEAYSACTTCNRQQPSYDVPDWVRLPDGMPVPGDGPTTEYKLQWNGSLIKRVLLYLLCHVEASSLDSIAGPEPGNGDARQAPELEMALTELINGVSEGLRTAGLKWKHVAGIKLFHAAETDASILKDMFLLAIGGATSARPSFAAIPVPCLRPGSVLQAQVSAYDLHSLVSEMWVRKEP